MADFNIGGSEGYENEKLFVEDDPTEYSMDKLFENRPPDRETTDPEQNLHQGFDPNASPSGCLPEPWINQGPSQAAASTHWSIAQQHSGQFPVIFTENPSSQIPDSLHKKRGYNRKYRANQKKIKHDLEDGNGKLKCENERLEREKHELEEKMKSCEAENGRLERWKHELEEKLKSCEAENGRLERWKHELEEKLKSCEAEHGRLEREKLEFEEKLKSCEAEHGRLEREKLEFEEKLKSCEAENGRLEREKLELEEKMESCEAENGRLERWKHELEEQMKSVEGEMKSTWAIEFKRFRDEFDSLRREDARELEQLRNKVDKLGLKQQNQSRKEKSSMSSTEEFWTESEEEDSVNSAKNSRVIRASERPKLANERVAASLYQLEVTTQSSECYKKFKKLLRKFPEIQDQKYDEKANKVTINVVSCSLEKISYKLLSEGGGLIEGIKINADGKPPTLLPPPMSLPPPPPLFPPWPRPWPLPLPPPPPPCKDKLGKASVDLHVQGYCYCEFCSRKPWGPCSCGGQVSCVRCYGGPVYDSWCEYGSGCEETQPGCTIM